MQKPYSIFLVVLVLIVGAVVGVHYFRAAKSEQPQACTDEAKECPDGSFVARTGPDCSFAACPEATSTTSSNGDGQGIAPFKSGISGTVQLGPTCPVEKNPPDPGCADKPYATVVTIYHAGVPNPFIIGTSDAAGAFRYALPPGTYTVTAGSDTALPRCASVSVVVPPESYATTTISCDTGIR